MSLPYHRLDGPEDGPRLILGCSLGTPIALWDPQVAELAETYRVLRFDLPGHGGTAADVLPSLKPGTTTIDDLAGLVIALADHYGWESFHYAGVSIGGAIGATLALRHPDRVASLAMVCSSARFGEPAAWYERALLVREQGTEPILESTSERWFAGRVHQDMLDAMAATDPLGYAACCDALAGYDVREELSRITVPVLVLGGRADVATPVVHARTLADGMPAATLVEVAGASHLANLDQPSAVTAALAAHLRGASTRSAADEAGNGTVGKAGKSANAEAGYGPEAEAGHRADAEAGNNAGAVAEAGNGAAMVTGDGERHALGMITRRAVLGDAHVDGAISRTTPFTADFQDFITRYAWGEIWTRPGLDRRTRSIVTLTALTARGHLEELPMHVRAALGNGLTTDEIGEVLLQCGVYCGVPAANAAFAVAQRVLNELGTSS